MDYKLLLIVLISALSSEVLADDKKRGEECKTANQKTGICLPSNQCQSAHHTIVSQNATDFGRKSCYSSSHETLVCCENPRLVPSLEEEINNVLGNDYCGTSKETTRISGGTVAEIGEFPWLVGILYKIKSNKENLGITCIGSLINDEYVLTAAHCLVNRQFIPTSVRLGDWNLATDPDCKKLVANTYCADPAQTVSVRDTIPHPYYSREYRNNDIGLIRLEKQVKFSEFVSPICLPPPDSPDHAAGVRMSVAGWGSADYLGTSSDILLKLDLPVVSEEACINRSSSSRRFSFSQICAGGEDKKDDKKRGEDCKTVNQKTGICLPSNQCQSADHTIVSKNATDFARKSCYSSSDETLVCCDNPSLAPSLEKELNNLLGIDICGISKETNRIGGGIVAEIGEFPWVVGILYKFASNNETIFLTCTGSLINDEYVLTTAHCLENRESITTSVRLGDWDLDTDPDCTKLVADTYCADPAQTVDVRDIIPHPYYSKEYRNNDIGLIRLERQVKFSEFVSPICLPPPDSPDHAAGARMTVAGWGETGYFNIRGWNVLMKGVLPIVSEEACINVSSISQRLSYSQICTGGDGENDICPGDIGAPLMYEHDEKIYQRGVTSYGDGCDLKYAPGVFTKVSDYLTWIVNVVTNYK